MVLPNNKDLKLRGRGEEVGQVRREVLYTIKRRHVLSVGRAVVPIHEEGKND